MAGIYIHIPFCKQRCTYCDFHFSTTFESYRERMIKAIVTEIELVAKETSFELETLYFGGGTPSLLTEVELTLIFEAINIHFGKTYVECTLESNPDDITEEKVALWKRLGVNRLSIGLQSFKEQDLIWMNRAHDTQQSYSCVGIAQKGGIDNITVDLMYGLPGLTDEEWRLHIQTVVKMGVQHVSAYCLTIEERTSLAKKVENEEICPLDEEQQARQFEILVEELQKNGIQQYEISNFALPGFQSKHNSSYWSGKPYVGIGPSAHSFSGNVRRWNVANNATYMKEIEKKGNWFESEELSQINQFNELLLTGLRTVKGVDLNQLANIAELDGDFWKLVQLFEHDKLLISDANKIVLTIAGRLQADFIASELFKSDQ